MKEPACVNCNNPANVSYTFNNMGNKDNRLAPNISTLPPGINSAVFCADCARHFGLDRR